jgi:uncharacterized protein (TIGR03435 family)
MLSYTSWRGSVGRVGTLAVALAVAGTATPQTPQAVAAEAAPMGSDGKPLTFDVISIRENRDVPNSQSPTFNGPTPDGYRLKGLPLFAVIQLAFLPSKEGMSFRPDRISGVPAWAFYTSSVRYDIDAKVPEVNLSQWKDPAQQPAMLRAMLQAMLADRFQLAAHRETKEIPIYQLALGKRAPKLKPSEATTLADVRREHPDAVTLRGGTIVTSGPNPGQQNVYGITMPDLGTFLSNLAGRPVQDTTGLTGRYDVTYQIELAPPPQEGASGAVSPDYFSSQIYSIVQQQLGLQLKSARGPVETLVIDHIEKPTEN